MAFRAQTGGTGVNSFNLTIPISVQAGDVMYILASNSAPSAVPGTFTLPSGWSVAVAQQQAGTGVTAVLWRRIATSGDAGALVAITNDGGAGVKSAAALAAWSGTDPVDPQHAIAVLASATVTASRVTPTVATAVDTRLVQMVTSKNTGGTNWTPPGGTTERSDIRAGGGGQVDIAIADSNADVSPGTIGGGTFVNDASTGTALTFTIALAGAAVTQTVRPVIDVTTDGWTATPALGVGEAQSSRVGEAVRDDATLVESSAGPSALVWESRLQGMPNPGINTGHRADYVLSTAGGAISSTIGVALMQGAVEIASWSETSVPDVPTPYTHAIATLDAADITDYDDLRLRFTATAA